MRTSEDARRMKHRKSICHIVNFVVTSVHKWPYCLHNRTVYRSKIRLISGAINVAGFDERRIGRIRKRVANPSSSLNSLLNYQKTTKQPAEHWRFPLFFWTESLENKLEEICSCNLKCWMCLHSRCTTGCETFCWWGFQRNPKNRLECWWHLFRLDQSSSCFWASENQLCKRRQTISNKTSAKHELPHC